MRLLIAAVVAVLFVGDAAAQSCNSLRKQLAAAQSGGGDVARLKAQHKAYGCGSNSRFGRHRSCASIESKLMRARGGGRQVASLQRRVNAACSQRKVVRRQPKKPESTMMIGGRVVTGVHTSEGRRSKSIFSSIFGGRREVSDETEVVSYEPAKRGVERVDLGNARPSRGSSGGDAYGPTATRSSGHRKGDLRVGNSRTVCVRLCDGFYFPINNRSHSDNFYDELAMCVGRCPGADVSLYAHNNSSPVESMRSTMTGERYVNLPTAFAYRKQVVPGCGCQPQTTGSPDEETVEHVVASLQEGEAATATDATEIDTAWTRYKAIYDETGKPLKPLKTDRTSEPPERPTGLTLPDPPNDDVSATTVALSKRDDLRDVGPQFNSNVWVQTRTALVRPKTTGISTSAVTVIPLGTTAPSKTRAASPLPTARAPAQAVPQSTDEPSSSSQQTAMPEEAGLKKEAAGPFRVSQGG